jgi:hypothetical protein
LTLLFATLVGCTDELDLELMPAPDGGVPAAGAGGAFDPLNPEPTIDSGTKPADAGMMMGGFAPLTCETPNDGPGREGMPCNNPIRWQEALTNGEPSSWESTFLAFDGNGNLYWLLTMLGHVDLVGREIGDPFTHTTLLISYSSDGQLRWVFDAFDAYADGLVVTDTQACVVLQNNEPLAGNLEPEHSGDGTVACLTLDGELRWSRSIASGLTWSQVISADPQGNLYVGGSFQGTLSISASQSVESRDAEEPGGKGDLFLVSYADSGEIRWLTTMGGSTNEDIHGVAALADGRVALLGAHGEDFVIAGESLPQLRPTGSQSGAGFVALFGEGGALEWAVRSPDAEFPPDHTLDPWHLLIDGRGRIVASYDFGYKAVAYDETGAVIAEYQTALGANFSVHGGGFVGFGSTEHPQHIAGAITQTDFDFVPQASRVLVDPSSTMTGAGVGGTVAVAADGTIAVSTYWTDQLHRRLVVLEP